MRNRYSYQAGRRTGGDEESVVTVGDILQGGRWYVLNVRLALQGISTIPIPELQEDIFLERYGWTHQEYMRTPYCVICSLGTVIEERANVQKEIQEQQEREMELKRSRV